MNWSMWRFARPSFLEGMARTLDISGSLNVYNEGRTPQEDMLLSMEADRQALHGDWLAAGLPPEASPWLRASPPALRASPPRRKRRR